jgi:parallel beta-helix repeat protein
MILHPLNHAAGTGVREGMLSSRSLARTLLIGMMVVLPRVAVANDVAKHAPIVITRDADFVACHCVAGGDGSASHPFVIGPWAITKVDGVAVFIDGTSLTKSFVIWNLTVGGNGINSSKGVVLQNINNPGVSRIVAAVAGAQTTIQAIGVGILVESSNDVTLDGGGANPSGAGIVSNGAGTINHNLIGAIDVENSDRVTVRGWQLSANGQDGTPDWIGFDPSLAHWGIGGVRFFGVTNSTIDHNAANNCTSISFSLFNSSGNTVTYNTADYPFTLNFLVTDGSSDNVVSNNVGSTADFIGYMVADPLPGTAALATYGPTHDNVFDSNISHTDGPTGSEVKAGIAPAFVGGFVVLNGTFNNVMLNNQDWASTGGGFVWAQAVPSNASPIGVVTEPPVLHCNVSASEGGGGVANRNGNVWIGNRSQAIDPCLPAQ